MEHPSQPAVPDSVPEKEQKQNVWSALTTVLTKSMESGQLIPIVLFVLLFSLTIRLSSQHSFDLLNRIGDALWKLQAVGWVFFILSIIAWTYHHRWVRQTYQREIDRIAEEKKFLQEQISRRTLDSSKGA